MIAGRHSMIHPGAVVVPTVFNYIGIKLVANRNMRSAASLNAYLSKPRNSPQLCKLEFVNSNSSTFSLPSDVTISYHNAYDDERHYSVETALSNSDMKNLFDGQTSTKYFKEKDVGFSKCADVYDFDTGDALMIYGNSYNGSFYTSHFGADNWTPQAVVLNISSNPIDIETYSRWRFYNGNDNASQTHRTWVEGEILGSVDKQTWWRLDIFNDTSIPNTNKAVAYTGNLVARLGDLWSDLDLMDRDWANGITVDSYQQGGGGKCVAFFVSRSRRFSRSARTAWKEAA